MSKKKATYKKKASYQDLEKSRKKLFEEKKIERQTAGKTLLKEAESEHLLTSISLIIYIRKPLGDHEITYISDNVRSQLGYEPEDILRSPDFWADKIHPDDRQTFFNSIEKLQENNRQACKYRLKDNKGIYRWLLDEFVLVNDKNDKPLEIVGCCLDTAWNKQSEEALRESEEKYRQLIEHAKDAIISTSINGELLVLNKVAAGYLGGVPEDYKGKTLWDIFPKDVADERMVDHKKIIQSGKGHTSENSIQFEGKTKWFLTSLQPILSSSKDVIAVLAIATDITERKQAEAEINRFKTIADSANYGQAIADIEGRLIYINKSFARSHGYEPEELIGKKLSMFHTEEQLGLVDNLNQILKEKGEYSLEEVPHVKKDGTEFPMLMSAILILDENDKPIYLGINAIDITKQKQAEEALQISEERFRNIAEETEDWIWEIGQNLVFKYSNVRIKNILGYDPEEVVGKSFLDFMSLEEIDRVDPEEEYRFLKDKIFSGQEIWMVRKDGETIVTESSGIPIFRRNRTFVGFQGLTRDITERVRAKKEEAQRNQQLIQADKMISLGILVSGVAHEINNPNQFIIVNAPMLQQIWKNITPIIDKYYEENRDIRLAGIPYADMRDRIPELFSEIYKGSQRIKQIVRNLKDYAREDNPDITHELNVNDVIRSVLIILANMLEKATKKLIVYYAENLPVIKGNSQRIEQVMINLIQNACQALPDRDKAIIITTFHNKKSGRVLIKIRDEGRGISEKNKKYILDPFFTSRRDTGGTGLGLSISAGIIENHGGKLEISSQLGEGTTVTVSFPVFKSN
jgi:PAS domain S-box-containing protein